MAQKKIEACLVCGEPLVYYETAREMTCVYCGRPFPSNAACEAGHFVCDAGRRWRTSWPIAGPVRAGTPSPSLRP